MIMTAMKQILRHPANDTPQPAWAVDSWRRFEAQQMPVYEDKAALNQIESTLKNYPPLALSAEAVLLKQRIADAADGKAFLLQGGDCAESFDAFNPENIRSSLYTLLKMARVIEEASTLPVIRVGRMAGQFAKPRSDAFETNDDMVLPSYRGDMINGSAFTADARRPDPQRIVTAYHQSASILNLLRGEAQAQKIDFYTAHEALLLPYEESMTRLDNGVHYGQSAHFLWIGDRTRQIDGAHVEYMRGIGNPIGLKCGPSLTPDDLMRLIEKLNPTNEPGRLTLISRMGCDNVENKLPPLIRAVKSGGWNVLWCCDPMHGNTWRSKSGYKTRAVEDIAKEIRQFFELHDTHGTRAGGVQLEMTGQNVTECVGGRSNVTDASLPSRYYTPCDPRLNAQQSAEIAHVIADALALQKDI